MAEQDIVKEFLVGLGFKVDEKQLKNFTAGIDTAAKAVTKFASIVVGASLTVATGVSIFASNLENLYFASQRVGSSVSSIKASELAARDLGASAGDAQAAMEGIARFMREKPGGESILKGLGIETRDANGNLRETSDMLVQVGQALAKMPSYQRKPYADILGINEGALRTITNPEYLDKQAAFAAKLKQNGTDKAAKDAHAFMEKMRKLKLELELISTKIQADLMTKFGPKLDELSDWLAKNGDNITDWVRKLVQYFVDLDSSTDGWSTKLLAFLLTMKALGLVAIANSILNLAAAFVRLGAGITTASGAAAGAGAAALTTLVTGVGALVYSESLNVGEDEEIRKIRLREGASPAEEQTAAQADRESDLVKAVKKFDEIDKDTSNRVADFFESMGWTKEQAAGITANLAVESNFDPKARGDWLRAEGVAQWHWDRQADFAKWAGFELRDDRADLMKQLEFVHYELTEGAQKKAGNLLKASKNARDAGRVVSRYYEKPKRIEEEAFIRGEIASQLIQNTTINVNGVGEPSMVAKNVADKQAGLAEQAQRNMSTPMVN